MAEVLFKAISGKALSEGGQQLLCWCLLPVLLLVLYLDSLTPLGFSHGILYLPLVFASIFTNRLLMVQLVTLVSVAFVLLGLPISADASQLPYTYVLGNRGLACLMILISGFFSYVTLRYLLLTKAQKQALADSQHFLEEKLRLLEIAGEIASFGGWTLSVADNRMSWTDEILNIHGLSMVDRATPEEALKLYVPEHRPILRQAIRNCIEKGEPFDLQLQIIVKGGLSRWVRVIGRPEYSEDGELVSVYGTLEDIHRLKSMQNKIEQSKQQFSQLANAMPMIVWSADSEGRANFFSDQLVELTGVPLEQLLRDGWLNVIHPKDRDRIRRDWTYAVESGADNYSSEFRIKLKSGGYHWHLGRAIPIRDEFNNVQRWYGTAMDIHHQKLVQNEFRELVERFETTLENISDAFISLSHDWRFTYINSKVEQLLSTRKQDILGKSLWEVFPTLTKTEVEARLLQAAKKEEPVSFDAFLDGFPGWVNFCVYPGQDGTTLILRDISKQKELEQQLQHSQRLEAVGQLTGGVAHDFNNLLTVIQGNAELLKEVLTEESLISLASIIETAAQRGATLTRQLLAFARRQALLPSVTDVNELLSMQQDLLQRTLGEHIEITLVLNDNLWLAMVDKSQLENAVLNLCINARDAMPGGGRLQIETQNIEVKVAESSDPLPPPGEFVQISVTDTGCGIAPEHLKQVFEPFFTTKELGKGTGLGLSMVFGFVKQSNGHVDITSTPGKGTTVTMYIPRAEQGREPQAVDDQVQVERGQGEVILVVEDDEAVRNYTCKVLENANYEVISARDGLEALEKLQVTKTVQLLFTDIVMPGGINGEELAEKAKSLWPELQILFTSGYAESLLSMTEDQAKNLHYISKPYDRKQLLRSVRACFSKDEN